MDSITAEVVEILVDTCGVDKAQITEQTNLISDLGIDSIDFLDATYDIDQKYRIKLPIEDWMESVNAGEADLEEFFVLEYFVNHIKELVKVAA